MIYEVQLNKVMFKKGEIDYKLQELELKEYIQQVKVKFFTEFCNYSYGFFFKSLSPVS